MPTYRIHDTVGDDLGLIEHPAPNVEPGDVVTLPYGRKALVTARVEAAKGPLEALLEVAIAPHAVDERRRPGPSASYLRIEERELDAGRLN